jgi:hypothetical protein
MQNYGTDKSRNVSRAAAAGTKGEISPMVSVKMPGVGNGGTMSSCKPGSKVKSPQGFSGGVISGKV